MAESSLVTQVTDWLVDQSLGEPDAVELFDGLCKRLTAIEVKSGRSREARFGLAAFEAEHGPSRRLLVGADGIAIEEFLARPAEHWIAR